MCHIQTHIQFQCVLGYVACFLFVQRTQEREDHLNIKIFLFQIVICYSVQCGEAFAALFGRVCVFFLVSLAAVIAISFFMYYYFICKRCMCSVYTYTVSSPFFCAPGIRSVFRFKLNFSLILCVSVSECMVYVLVELRERLKENKITTKRMHG